MNIRHIDTFKLLIKNIFILSETHSFFLCNIVIDRSKDKLNLNLSLRGNSSSIYNKKKANFL